MTLANRRYTYMANFTKQKCENKFPLKYHLRTLKLCYIQGLTS